MPRHHVNRVRAFALFHTGDHLDKDTRQTHLHWEWLAAYLYVAGCLFLVVGSILSLPQCPGGWPAEELFVVASLLFLWVSLHELAEIWKATTPRTTPALFEVYAGVSYALGAVLWIVASLLFLSEDNRMQVPAASCRMGGSVLFVLGAGINGVQTYDSLDKTSLQYATLESLAFVAGSCVSICASVPYLVYDLESSSETIWTIVAALYLWGSCCFLVGGTLNVFRLLSVHNDYIMATATTERVLPHLTKTFDESSSSEDHGKLGQLSYRGNRTFLDLSTDSHVVFRSILSGNLMEMPSAEDLVFGEHDAKEPMDFSIRNNQEEMTA